jgi:hypothetical protein
MADRKLYVNLGLGEGEGFGVALLLHIGKEILFAGKGFFSYFSFYKFI